MICTGTEVLNRRNEKVEDVRFMKKKQNQAPIAEKPQSFSKEVGGVEYRKLLTDIKARVLSAQYEALRAVNRELVALYWDIGRMIVERQEPARPGARRWSRNWPMT